ncbi:MAG: hypothetical protein P3T54_02715 [Dehalogenimonas sp.]|uniref:Type II toxin-antitoxin system HicB family antitoxin n=1 Tax=Candidatus Dehalogenimonas loeffleri TaxID=3127115 RepID=A0ABZ2J4V7_9CHLR|nr:hypothetical protein [Dehalogenimonas sp.]
MTSSNGYIQLTLEFSREGRRWLGRCRELGTSTFGRTLTEADAKLREAVDCHLNTLEEVGERERFFRDHHIVVRPAAAGRAMVEVEMPAESASFIKTHLHDMKALAGVN